LQPQLPPFPTRRSSDLMHAAWGAKGYMMSHDEIRVLNWCDACQRRHLDAGALVADNVKTCIQILREINPGGHIYVWSDMFDPQQDRKSTRLNSSHVSIS